MEKGKFYVLPKLPYDYKDLEPYISEGQLARAVFDDTCGNLIQIAQNSASARSLH